MIDCKVRPSLVPQENSSGPPGQANTRLVRGSAIQDFQSCLKQLFFLLIAVLFFHLWPPSCGRPRRWDRGHEGKFANTVVVGLWPCPVVLGVSALLESAQGRKAGGCGGYGRLLRGSALNTELPEVLGGPCPARAAEGEPLSIEDLVRLMRVTAANDNGRFAELNGGKFTSALSRLGGRRETGRLEPPEQVASAT